MTALYETRSEKTLPPRTEQEEVTELAALMRRSGADAATTLARCAWTPSRTRSPATMARRPSRRRSSGSLRALASPGAVVRRRDMVRAALPEGAIVHDNTPDQYVARLRRKLRDVSAHIAIETAHGVGYRFR